MNKILHAAGSVIFGITLYYDLVHVRIPSHLLNLPNLSAAAKWPGKLKYLTFWNLNMLFAFQVLSLVNDILGSNVQDVKKQTKLQRYRDFTYASLIFPVGFFVSLSFWGLYLFDRQLVYPDVMDEFIPSLFNHAVHTGPAVSILVESFLIPKIYPKRATSLLTTVIFVTVYIFWILWVAFISDVWVYPILAVLKTPARILFIAGCAFIFAGMYLIGEKFHLLIWGTKGFTDSQSRSSKKRKQ
ncbi:unnamed protein product [Allacma fusca]|uniref:Androgen-dependent TFPI-regulating protein n=1 Tax=Allacma fusca TaxID=39272 RepID=A0A8J2P6Z0_9HEXA|nr:unnamed protein product [Allacma fusca]